MKKVMAFLFVAALAIIIAPPAHAQVLGDDGGEVLSRDLPPDECPTYDSCSMVSGAGGDPNAGGIKQQTCQSNMCAVCTYVMVNDSRGVASSCQRSPEPGSCKCEIGASGPGCTLTGTCYYHA
jgi:hypothetical protein